MLSISAKGVYGVRAMVYLCESQGSGPLQTRDIAESCSIPTHYLEQIMAMLRRAGLVRSHRGPNGGYSVTQSTDRISVLAILSELDGAPALLAKELRDGPLGFYWETVEQELTTVLQCSLGELVRRRQKLRNNFTYSI